MVTSNQEYNELLYAINDPNSINGVTEYYRIPGNEPVYEINLNTREIKAPSFLSVLDDKNAEVIWFKVDRFHDDIDLFGAACWIEYKNALKEQYVSVTYPRPINDNNHNVLYIPWTVNNSATRAAGTIEFSFRFFKTREEERHYQDEVKTVQVVYYDLHTKPARSKVLNGLRSDDEIFEYDSAYEAQITELESLIKGMSGTLADIVAKREIYWLEV